MQRPESDGRSADSKSLRVMHVLRSPVGGLFRHVCDLAREQCRRGLSVGIVCDSSTGGEHSESQLQSLGNVCQLGIHPMPMSRIPGISDVRVFRTIRGIVHDASPDVIHGHGAKGAAYARLVASSVDAKAVFTPHGGSLHYTNASLSGAIFLNIERLLKSRTDGIIFESDFARLTFEKNIGSIQCPYRVIHNGLHEAEFASLDGKAATYDFVFIGEIRELKGIGVLIQAIDRLSRTMDFSTLIVGSGEKEAFLKSKIAECGLGDRITVSPAIHPATRALQQGRCMLMPSLGESFPYIVLECVAAGMPLVATRVGGIPEIFGPLSSRLLPPGDDEKLAAAMRQFLLEPSVAKDDAEVLRQSVRQNFSVDKMTSETVAFYGELVN